MQPDLLQIILGSGGSPRLILVGKQFQDLLCRHSSPRSVGEGLAKRYEAEESAPVQSVAHRAAYRTRCSHQTRRQLQGNPRSARTLLSLSADVTEWQPLIAWAFSQEKVKEPSARFVLTCLAHHARQDGSNSFPSVATLMKYTGLSERTVRSSLRLLEAANLIRRGQPSDKIRPDRRPMCYDLQIPRGATIAPRGVTGGNERLNGGQPAHPRGAMVAPDLPSESSTRNKSALEAVTEELEARFGIKTKSGVK
jgi:hypothetical protein